MVHFAPMVRGHTRHLVSTGLDGCVCFWSWNILKMTFDPKPVKFVERSRAGAGMRCSSFSPGGQSRRCPAVRRMARDRHGFPKFHLGPPYPTFLRPTGGPPLNRPYGRFRDGPPAGRAWDRLLPFWKPDAVRLCPLALWVRFVAFETACEVI
jgi:hypothetical protein